MRKILEIRTVVAAAGLLVGTIAAVLALSSSRFSIFDSRTAKFAQIPPGVRLTADSCILIPASEEDKVYFISCGGIY